MIPFVLGRRNREVSEYRGGGTLTLAGDSVGVCDLFVGFNNAAGTGTISIGNMNMSGGTFNATLDELVVGRHASGGGGGQGSFTLAGVSLPLTASSWPIPILVVSARTMRTPQPW